MSASADRTPTSEGVDVDALASFFGAAWPTVRTFHDLLAEHGETRGLIGPRELDRLWTRHILNSAAPARFLPESGAVADVGSGAGLPGIVLAAMRPDLPFHLVEPMQRRVAWLAEAASHVGLANVTVHGARAEELHGSLHVDVVTARAVAAVGKLAAWTVPLLKPGGRLVLLKGRRVSEELDAAAKSLRKLGVTRTELHRVDLLDLGDPTVVLEARVR